MMYPTIWSISTVILFSGKSFLKSIEILYADRDEWTTLSLVQKTKLDQSQPNIESL